MLENRHLSKIRQFNLTLVFLPSCEHFFYSFSIRLTRFTTVGGVAIGIGIPVFAIDLQQKKAGLK